MLSVIIATGVLCIGFIWANSVSVLKNNDEQPLGKAFIERSMSLRIIDEFALLIRLLLPHVAVGPAHWQMNNFQVFSGQ